MMKLENKRILIVIRLFNLLFNIKISFIVRFIKDFNDLRAKSGIKYAINYMKVARLHVTRYICGKPLKSNKSLVSLTKDYFPKRFLYLKEYVDNPQNSKDLRGVLTLFYYTRSVSPTIQEQKKLQPSFDTITKQNHKKFYTIPSWFVKSFVSKYKLSSNVPEYSNELHYISSKSSPYGKATLNSTYGLFSMSNVHHNILNYWINLIGEDRYMKMFGNLIKSLWEDNRLFSYKTESGHCGKLSIIKDPELKLRVIAMVDYNSQVLLKPIHDNLLNLLRRFPSDRTFNQDPFNNWKKDYNHFHSLDLSAATDRFPIHLQEKLISYMYNNKMFAESWKNILVKRSYGFEGKSYYYSVGQPMGAYSSWAAFTITHHLVVHWSAYLEGYLDFKDYILLGDDIVIKNNKVARRYKSIMNKLGVDISEAKSHVSKDTYEFAKRWIRKGIEISPLPLKGILNNINNPQVVLQQLMNYIIRSRMPINCSVLELIEELYNKIKINGRFFTKSSINQLCYKFYYSYKYSLGLASNEEMRVFFMRYLPEHIPVPRSELIPDFIRELLIGSLSSEVEKLSTSASQTFKKFIDYYKSKKLGDIGMLRYHPFTHALYHQLNRKYKILQDSERLSNTDLIDNIVHMRIEEVDKLVEEFRDPYMKVAKLDKLWDKSRLILKKINLEFESHWSRAPLLEGATPYVDHNYFKSKISGPLSELDILRYGKYNDPDAPMQYW
jgi:hypothetical protein